MQSFPPRLTTPLYISTPYDSNLGNTIYSDNNSNISSPHPGYTFANHFNPIVASGSVDLHFGQLPALQGRLSDQVCRRIHEQSRRRQQQRRLVGRRHARQIRQEGPVGHFLSLSAARSRCVVGSNRGRRQHRRHPATQPTTLAVESGAAAGGTNIKGHLIKFNYSIYDSLTFSFTAYINELINQSPSRHTNRRRPRDGRPDVEVLTGT